MKTRPATKVPVEAEFKLGGTGFMIDPRGYIVTNAHVIGNSTVVIVQNNKGQEFKTKIVYISPTADLAFLKIMDSDFKAPPAYPMPSVRVILNWVKPFSHWVIRGMKLFTEKDT